METVARNAAQALALHKTKRGQRPHHAQPWRCRSCRTRSACDEAPLRIECYDVSHLQESDVVASMVVFEDGLARKSEYRRFVVRGYAGRGDVASIHEVIGRRFRRYVDERAETGEVESGHGSTTRRAGPRSRRASTRRPAGRGGSPTRPTSSSSTAARRRSRRPSGRSTSSASTTSPSCGLAKRLEEVWLPGDPHPVVLPRTSEGLYLLQRVRDEAHRFAITYHRSRRSRSMTASALDGVPGLGDDPPQGAAQALRLAQAAARRHRRRGRRGARHRPADRRGRGGRTGRAGRAGRRPSTPRPVRSLTTTTEPARTVPAVEETP